METNSSSQTKELNTPEETKITITLPINAYFISGIRDFTLNIIKNTTKFSEQWAYRFQSVVDELCNNAIEYGSAPGKEIKITFIHSKEKYVEIIVEDTGTGKNKITASQLQKLFEERTEPGYLFTGIRGRGLIKIVKEWTDEIKFEESKQGGIKINVKKYLKEEKEKEEVNTNKINLQQESSQVVLN